MEVEEAGGKKEDEEEKVVMQEEEDPKESAKDEGKSGEDVDALRLMPVVETPQMEENSQVGRKPIVAVLSGQGKTFEPSSQTQSSRPEEAESRPSIVPVIHRIRFSAPDQASRARPLRHNSMAVHHTVVLKGDSVPGEVLEVPGLPSRKRRQVVRGILVACQQRPGVHYTLISGQAVPPTT